MSSYVEIHADGWRFQPRVAAVCVWQDHVLLQGALDGPFWVLPGGRLLPLELTADALVRTMRWEIGQEVTVQRLLWVMEYLTPIGGQPVHELGFYYAVDLPENSSLFDLTHDHAGVERGHDLVLRWAPVDALPDLPLFPEFLRTAVRQMPDSPSTSSGWTSTPDLRADPPATQSSRAAISSQVLGLAAARRQAGRFTGSLPSAELLVGDGEGAPEPLKIDLDARHLPGTQPT